MLIAALILGYLIVGMAASRWTFTRTLGAWFADVILRLFTGLATIVSRLT